MQLLHNMENKTILLVNDKYRKMENFYFYDKMPYLSVFFLYFAQNSYGRKLFHFIYYRSKREREEEYGRKTYLCTES